MKAQTDKAGEGESQSLANGFLHKENDSESLPQFRDNSPDAIAQGKLRVMADNDPRVTKLNAFKEMANNSLDVKQVAQLKAMADRYIPWRQKPIFSDKESPVQLLSKTIDIGGGKNAEIEYSFGASVDETNTHELGAELFQEMGAFICSASLDVTLDSDMEEPLEFGFIANVMSSVREAFYDSTKKTKAIATLPGQILDGDGEAPPFAIPPMELPKTAGKHSIKLQYTDNPLSVFPRKDPNAEGEGNTLKKISGKDKHKVWLAVGNPSQQGLNVFDSIVWEVTWDAEIDNTSGQVTVTGGGGLLSAQGGGPVWEGKFGNDSFTMSEATWK